VHKIYTIRNRRIVLAHLAKNHCVDCGESDVVVLDFDHVRGEKYFAISRLIVGGTSVAHAATRNGQVRCALRKLPPAQTALERGSYRNTPWLYQDDVVAAHGPGDADETLGRGRIELPTNGLKGRCSTG
jgi:hypothetical protein